MRSQYVEAQVMDIRAGPSLCCSPWPHLLAPARLLHAPQRAVPHSPITASISSLPVPMGTSTDLELVAAAATRRCCCCCCCGGTHMLPAAGRAAIGARAVAAREKPRRQEGRRCVSCMSCMALAVTCAGVAAGCWLLAVGDSTLPPLTCLRQRVTTFFEQQAAGVLWGPRPQTHGDTQQHKQ